MAAPRNRASVLCVGYSRRPFSIHVHDNQVRTVALQLGIKGYFDKWKRYCNPQERFKRWDYRETNSFHVRLFRAVRADTGECLRLGHEHTTALMRIETQPNADELLAMYLTFGNDVTNFRDSKRRLAELLGLTADAQDADSDHGDDRIHLLAVLVRDLEMPALPYSALSLSHLALDYQFRVARGYIRDNDEGEQHVLHGAIDDVTFHHDKWAIGEQYDLMGVLNAASMSDHPLKSLPAFDRVAFTFGLCSRHQRPTPPRSPRPRSLQRLAEDAALRAVLHENPPQYVDAVDCVLEATLYNGSEQVADGVLCYVKFDAGEQDWFMFDDLYVSPRMLATLDMVATLGDAARPRLLVFAFLHQIPNRNGHIDWTCLPHSFPSIAICTSRRPFSFRSL